MKDRRRAKSIMQTVLRVAGLAPGPRHKTKVCRDHGGPVPPYPPACHSSGTRVRNLREAMVRRLEELSLARAGTWDWFQANGGITDEQVRQVLGVFPVRGGSMIEAQGLVPPRLALLAEGGVETRALQRGAACPSFAAEIATRLGKFLTAQKLRKAKPMSLSSFLS